MIRSRLVLGWNLAALFAVALALRVVHLDRMPGINGDEAWYGVQAIRFLRGEGVSWRTPSGNPLNPFFAGIDALLLAVVRPSFLVLRIPSLVCGVLTVGLAFVLGRRALDRRTALIAAVLLASLPIMIGYSRFGWDASQTPLASLLVVAFALRGRGIALGLAFVALLLVHPCNVFLLPVAGAAFGVAAARRWADQPSRRKRLLVECLVLALLIGGAIAWLVPWTRAAEPAPGRWTDPGQWALYLTHLGRLFSGVTLYRYLVRPDLPESIAWLHDRGFWLVVLTTLPVGLARLVRARCWERLALVLGLLVSIFGLYAVGGAGVIAPSVERYGMCLVVPAALVFASLVTAAVPRFSQARLALVSILGWLLLWSVQANYFGRMMDQRSHPTFRTAGVEPKRRALAWILRDRARLPDPAGPTRVLAEDWWLYWPLEFLASSGEAVAVTWLDSPALPAPRVNSAEGDIEAQRRQVVDELRRGAYVVGFADGRADRFPGGRVEQIVRSSFAPGEVHRRVIRDGSGHPILAVFRLARPEAAAVAGRARAARR
jgi:4-amino-4-deoxy-L-arabinose transferase-like glycosyltransferase